MSHHLPSRQTSKKTLFDFFFGLTPQPNQRSVSVSVGFFGHMPNPNRGRKFNIHCIALFFCALALILTPYLFFVWQDRSETQRIANFYIKREPPHVEVKHLWRHAPDHKTFFVFDVYQAIFPADYDPNSMDVTTSSFEGNTPLSEWRLVLAEGAVPGLNFPTPFTYDTDLQCVWAGETTTTTPKLQFLRYKKGEIEYRQRSESPFSVHDAYLFQFILCPLPSPSSTSLVALQSTRANYRLDLGDATPVPTSLSNHRIVMCMVRLLVCFQKKKQF